MASAPAHARTTTHLVRQRIEAGGERFWRFADFRDLPLSAVAQALSRLARTNLLRRLSRGVYYRSRQTAFGESLPNVAALQALASEKAPVFPAGLAAANLLGFTTQTPRSTEVATTATSLPRALVGEGTIVHTRRPAAWKRLSREDAALLDFLRQAGRTSELPPDETARRTLAQLADDGRYARLLRAATTEPPRVRALLGALGELQGADGKALAKLRRSLNPLTRFDFGAFASLPTATAWQARVGAAA
jgi:hypothetical protein